MTVIIYIQIQDISVHIKHGIPVNSNHPFPPPSVDVIHPEISVANNVVNSPM